MSLFYTYAVRVTQEKMLELGWLNLPHLIYSPVLAPTDFYISLLLTKLLKGKTFKSEKQVRETAENFSQLKLTTFFKEGIYKRPIK